MFELFDETVEWFGDLVGLDLDTTYGMSEDEIMDLERQSNIDKYGVPYNPYEAFTEDSIAGQVYDFGADVVQGIKIGAYFVPVALVGLGYLFIKNNLGFK